MGLGIVLLFWAVAGIIFSAVGSATLAWLAALLTRRVMLGRRRVIIVALFRFACLGWGGCVFVWGCTPSLDP